MGLDISDRVYVRAAGTGWWWNAAALSAASAIPTGSATEVNNRAAAFNSKNNYAGSSQNMIKGSNVNYVQALSD